MKASIRCSKGVALILTFLLALMMIMPTSMVYAASTYTATGSETGDQMERQRIHQVMLMT